MNDRVDMKQKPQAWNHYNDHSCVSQRLIIEREKVSRIIELFAALASAFFHTNANLKYLEANINYETIKR